MKLGRYYIIPVPRFVHPWYWGRRKQRLYLGPILIYKSTHR